MTSVCPPPPRGKAAWLSFHQTLRAPGKREDLRPGAPSLSDTLAQPSALRAAGEDEDAAGAPLSRKPLRAQWPGHFTPQRAPHRLQALQGSRELKDPLHLDVAGRGEGTATSGPASEAVSRSPPLSIHVVSSEDSGSQVSPGVALGVPGLLWGHPHPRP